jgi:hypothetical protein
MSPVPIQFLGALIYFKGKVVWNGFLAYLKGLSHEIDFKHFDQNLKNLA